MYGLKYICFLLVILNIFFMRTASETTFINSVRSLKTGDSFTPEEMLPLAIKLLEKVPEPGSGKGIVSAARNSEDLADKLFEAFFMTSKRFVTLTEIDIKDLDALQALALSGEVANGVTEPSANATGRFLRGLNFKLPKEGSRYKYKLLTKKTNRKININRRGIELAKKLSKKRRIIVNSRRGLRKKTADIGAPKGKNKAKPEYKNNLRKMVGISALDEEVEKMLQTRILHVKPNKPDEKEHIESLGEYFQRIIMAQVAAESTATAAVTENSEEGQSEGNNEPTKSIIDDEVLQNDTIDIGSQSDGATRRRLRYKRKYV